MTPRNAPDADYDTSNLNFLAPMRLSSPVPKSNRLPGSGAAIAPSSLYWTPEAETTVKGTFCPDAVVRVIPVIEGSTKILPLHVGNAHAAVKLSTERANE